MKSTFGAKFYKALDAAALEEKYDPDLFFDRLPQPYRMICKILEFDILDRAWFEIIRLHPEVQSDFTGDFKQAKKRNQKLEAKCLPSTLSEQHSSASSAIDGSDYTYVAYTDGSLSVVDIRTGKLLGSTSVFKNNKQSIIKLYSVGYTNGKRGRIERIVASCHSIMLQQPVSITIPNSNHNHPAAASHALPIHRIDISIIDVDVENLDSQNNPLAKVIPKIPFSIYLENVSNPDEILVSLTQDGNLLAITLNNELLLYSLYEYHIKSDTSILSIDNSKDDTNPLTINEDLEFHEILDSSTVILQKPTSKLDLTPFSRYHRSNNYLDPNSRGSDADVPAAAGSGSLNPLSVNTSLSSKPRSPSTTAQHQTSNAKLLSALTSHGSSGAVAGTGAQGTLESARYPKEPYPRVKGLVPYPLNPTRGLPPTPLAGTNNKTSDRRTAIGQGPAVGAPAAPSSGPSGGLPPNSIASSASTASASTSILGDYICNHGIAVMWEDTPEWCLLGLRQLPFLPEDSAPKDEVGGKDRNAKNSSGVRKNSGNVKAVEKTKNGTPPRSPKSPKSPQRSTSRDKSPTNSSQPSSPGSPILPSSLAPNANQTANSAAVTQKDDTSALVSTRPSIPLEPFELNHWSLSSPVASYCTDQNKCLLAMGLRDGCVVVWDLRNMIICGGEFGKHETPVTQMVICVGKSIRLVTGALDGSLCFFNIQLGPDSNFNSPNPLLNDTTVGSYRVSLLNFKHDVRAPIISLTNIRSTSLLVVVTGKGNTVLYDTDDVDILGSLVGRSLQPGMPASWRPFSVSRLAHLDPVNDFPVKSTNSSAPHIGSKKSDQHSSQQDLKDKVGKHDLKSTHSQEVQEKVKADRVKFPISWPDAKLISLLSSGVESVKLLEPLRPISASCVEGYCVVYENVSSESEGSRNTDENTVNTTALAMYSVSQILMSLCPGVAAVVNEIKGLNDAKGIRETSTNPSAIYVLLSSAQRCDSELKLQDVDALKSYSNFNQIGTVLKAKTILKGSSSATLGNQTQPFNNLLSGPGNTGLISSVPSPKKAAAGQSSSNFEPLTEKKLRMFDTMTEKININPPAIPISNPQYVRISNWDYIKTPESISNKARSKSSQERKQRALKLMNRLQDMSSLFE